jgi:hypothetical protein
MMFLLGMIAACTLGIISLATSEGTLPRRTRLKCALIVVGGLAIGAGVPTLVTWRDATVPIAVLSFGVVMLGAVFIIKRMQDVLVPAWVGPAVCYVTGGAAITWVGAVVRLATSYFGA